jgi:hypothetical protein
MRVILLASSMTLKFADVSYNDSRGAELVR